MTVERNHTLLNIRVLLESYQNPSPSKPGSSFLYVADWVIFILCFSLAIGLVLSLVYLINIQTYCSNISRLSRPGILPPPTIAPVEML